MSIEINIQSPAVLFAMRQILTRIPELALEAMGDSAKTLRNIARGRTPVGIGPTQGQLKGAWSEVGMASEGVLGFENPIDYGYVLEGGLYPGVGPRTVAVAGGIYSRQAPGGILGPMLEDDATLGDAVETVTRQVVRELERLVVM